jgi:prepilin-type processing-associated H-X9-DG protein
VSNISETVSQVLAMKRQPPLPSDQNRFAFRTGFTIVELLVTMGVVGGLLVVLIPALGVARESARRLECHNHLKQIGLALHSYHYVSRFLPPAWRWDDQKVTAFGWIPPLLPFLGSDFPPIPVDFQSAVSSPANLRARESTPTIFQCPSDLSEKQFLLYSAAPPSGSFRDIPLVTLPSANYVGVFGIQEPDDHWWKGPGEGVFHSVDSTRFDDIGRGLSQVFLVGERRTSSIPSTWLGIDSRGEDAHCRILGNANRGPNFPYADQCEFTSRHRGAANFLFADGHVDSISNSIDPETYQQMARRNPD